MADEEEGKPHIIIDNGSYYIKAGFSGDEGPKTIFRNIIGRMKYKKNNFNFGGDEKEIFIDEEAIAKRGMLDIKSPMNRIMVKNWDNMEKIWEYIFKDKLKVDPSEHNLLISQPLNNLKINKEKTTEIMFETFKTQGLFLALQPFLSLYASGKFTGFIIEMGDGTTQYMPIFDGYIIDDRCERINIGGKDITNYMRKILNKKGFNFERIFEKILSRRIKEEGCYIPISYKGELPEPFKYKLPDGTFVEIGEERIKYPEAFIFNPQLKGIESKGIGEMCNDLIQKCDEGLRKDLYNAIILSGGNSMLKGLPERLTKEIKDLAIKSMKEEIKVIASPERKFSVWIGGSILSSISTFEASWITKKEYEESGVGIIHRK